MNSNFTRDDLEGRTQFIKDFKKNYIIQHTDEFCKTDMLLTGKTKSGIQYDRIYEVELKYRWKYTIYQLSGSTMIEEHKLQELIRKYNENPERTLIYFNYYLGFNYIAYDITGRIKNNILPPIEMRLLPQYTSICSEKIWKPVRFLDFRDDIYIKDKMVIR